MRQVTITTAEGLYDLLAADTAVASLLGTFQLGGASFQGLLVAADSDPLEGITKATGAVAVIQRDPTVRSSPLLNGGAIIERHFTIRLIQFQASTFNLRSLTERILTILPGSDAVPLGGPAALAGRGQMVLHLPANPVALTD